MDRKLVIVVEETGLMVSGQKVEGNKILPEFTDDIEKVITFKSWLHTAFYCQKAGMINNKACIVPLPVLINIIHNHEQLQKRLKAT